MREKNILARVEEKHVLTALKELPHPEEVTQDEFRETVIEVPRLGRVCFTCHRIVERMEILLGFFPLALGGVGGGLATEASTKRAPSFSTLTSPIGFTNAVGATFSSGPYVSSG